MPQVNVSLESLSDSIKKLNKEELENLLLSLSYEGEKLLSRKKDIIDKKVKTLSRKEVFGV